MHIAHTYAKKCQTCVYLLCVDVKSYIIQKLKNKYQKFINASVVISKLGNSDFEISKI